MFAFLSVTPRLRGSILNLQFLFSRAQYQHQLLVTGFARIQTRCYSATNSLHACEFSDRCFISPIVPKALFDNRLWQADFALYTS